MAGEWLTYAELAKRLGTSTGAARVRAQRRRWKRQVGNDGLAKVFVPEDEELCPARAPNVRPHDPPDVPRTYTHEAELLKRLGELQGELAALAQRLATAEGRAGAAEAQVEGLRAVLEVERRQAGELRAERDQAVERLNLNTDRLDRVQAEHHAELMVVREQMARAEHDHDRVAAELAAHLALPWWRRLLA